MPKRFDKGVRISAWLPPKQRETAAEIANLSKFFQICLDHAPDIMAWAILREVEPQKYETGRQLNDVIDEFNQKYPLDPLTAKRLNNGTSTQREDSSGSQETNPALQ